MNFYHTNAQAIQQVVNRELQELHRREKIYRGNRPWPNLKDKCVILVDKELWGKNIDSAQYVKNN